MNKEQLRSIINEEINNILNEDQIMISYQGKLKRVIDKYLSNIKSKGDIYKAPPTIIRGQSWKKTERKITYIGDFKIYTTKDAWNAVVVYFTNALTAEEYYDIKNKLNDLINDKYKTDIDWFDDDHINYTRMTITDTTIKNNLIFK